MRLDDYSGTVSLFYKLELIDRRRYKYNWYLLGKDAIINSWKKKYGKAFYRPEVWIKIEDDNKKN